MGSNEEDKFYMVANAYSEAGIPCNYLREEPSLIFYSELDAEKHAVELGVNQPKNKFVILEATAIVEVKNGAPIWNEI